MTINERIRYLRKDILNLTQQEFSSAIKISRSNMGNIETGEVAATERVIASICERYNVNEQWLKSGSGDTFRKRSPSEEIGYYVEDLLEYDGNGNPFFDIIIEMMKSYHELDEQSKAVIKAYFDSIVAGLKKEEKEG